MQVRTALKRKYVDKYRVKDAFLCLNEQNKSELIENISELVHMNDNDDKAVEFDNIMYGLMLAYLENKSIIRHKHAVVSKVSILLDKKATLPQIKEKMSILKEVREDEYWKECDVLKFEKIRVELRGLMKFAVLSGRKDIFTNLKDEELERSILKEFEADAVHENYKLKVNKYIEDNKDNIAIHKLRNNIPLNEEDYKILEKIFTGELGTKDDYQKNFQDTPFGLLVRRVAKLERSAAMKVFSSFINHQNLNANQISFVNKVIDYIEQNGYVESISELTKPPFDKPQSFIKLFDEERRKEFVDIINEVKDNATRIIS